MSNNPLAKPIDIKRDIKHAVKRGESLASITTKYFGSPQYWEFLYYFNCRIDVANITGCRPLAPNLLYESQVLLIPAVGNRPLPSGKSSVAEQEQEKKAKSNSNYLAMQISNIFKDGVEFDLSEAPGVSYGNQYIQYVMKYTGGKINIKLTDEEEFSKVTQTYAKTETLVDKMGEMSRDIFRNVMKSPKLTPSYELKQVLHLKNWANGTALIPKKVKMSYDLGAFHSELSAQKGEYSKAGQYFKSENQSLNMFKAETGMKSEHCFCSVEFSFDTPPLVLSPKTLLFKASMKGNMGGQMEGVELAWKDYGADVDLIITAPNKEDNSQHRLQVSSVPAGFFAQKTVEQYVSENYSSTSTSSLYTDPGSKFGAEIAEQIATGKMSDKEALVLGAGIVGSIVVSLGIVFVVSEGLVASAGAMIMNGFRFLGKALDGIIPKASLFAPTTAFAAKRESSDTITGADPQKMSPARERERMLMGPAHKFTTMKKTIPLELVLSSQRKLHILKTKSGKKTPVEFKI